MRRDIGKNRALDRANIRQDGTGLDVARNVIGRTAQGTPSAA
jgi:hypothetical protein